MDLSHEATAVSSEIVLLIEELLSSETHYENVRRERGDLEDPGMGSGGFATRGKALCCNLMRAWIGSGTEHETSGTNSKAS